MPNSYPMQRMTPEELSEAIERAHLTAGQFLFLTGVSRLTLRAWLHSDKAQGESRVPSWAPGYLAALTVDEAKLRAAKEMFERSEYETTHFDIIREQILRKED